MRTISPMRNSHLGGNETLFRSKEMTTSSLFIYRLYPFSHVCYFLLFKWKSVFNTNFTQKNHLIHLFLRTKEVDSKTTEMGIFSKWIVHQMLICSSMSSLSNSRDLHMSDMSIEYLFSLEWCKHYILIFTSVTFL